MRYTTEQQNVIEASLVEPLVLVDSVAGSGKSSVLEGVAEAHNNEKCTYIVFNKEQEIEAKRRFNKKVRVHTTHALAYNYVIRQGLELDSNNKLIESTDMFGISTTKPRKLGSFNVNTIVENIKAREKEKVVYWFEVFCKSQYLTVDEFCKVEEKANKRKDLLNKYFNLMVKKQIDVTFEFNLKYLQILSVAGVIDFGINVLLVDELQDFSIPMLEVLKHINVKHIVGVGDKNQQLYSFAGAVNGFSYLADQNPKYMKLTQSFRVPTKVAKKIEIFGRLYLDPNFEFKGTDNQPNILTEAYITSTNSALIEQIELFHLQRKPYRLTRSVASIFEAVKVIMYLNKKGVYNKKYSFLNRGIDEYFSGKTKAKSLIGYIKTEYSYHIEIQAAISIVLKMGNIRLKKLMEEAKLNEKKIAYKTARTTLATSHTLKGKTFSKVFLDSGLLPKDEILDTSINFRTIEEQEALNNLYVAATRCNQESKTTLIDQAIKYKLKEKHAKSN